MEITVYEMERLLVDRARELGTVLTFDERIEAIEKLQKFLNSYKEEIITDEIERRKEKVFKATEAVEEMRIYTKK